MFTIDGKEYTNEYWDCFCYAVKPNNPVSHDACPRCKAKRDNQSIKSVITKGLNISNFELEFTVIRIPVDNLMRSDRYYEYMVIPENNQGEVEVLDFCKTSLHRSVDKKGAGAFSVTVEKFLKKDDGYFFRVCEPYCD